MTQVLHDDRPGEACGVFGIRSTLEIEASRLTYFGLFALQHRGQESAGIAVSDGENLTVFKDIGLVAQVFDESTLAGLPGNMAIGHNRYSTTGSNVWANSQPIYRQVGRNGVALGHNGNLTNTKQLAEELGSTTATSDSELMTEAVAVARGEDANLQEAVARAARRFEGAFSLVVMDKDTMVGVRDPNGFRPLSIGRLDDAWVLASETAAFDLVGAQFVRDVEPGEVVAFGPDGQISLQLMEKPTPTLCLFEFVYFSRPDSALYGQSVHGARHAMGRALARQAPADVDIVVPVPESGIPAAQGYAAETGISYTDALVKNRYVGRTFIDPAQTMRERGIRVKLNPMPHVIEGKRIVLVDDSVVRGNTTKQLVAMMRRAGAVEVHLRVSSPPYRWPCFYGMDTGDRSTLIGAGRTVPEIAKFLEVDSLEYLELESLIEATGAPADGFCTACLSGEYPTSVPTEDTKHVLEKA